MAEPSPDKIVTGTIGCLIGGLTDAIGSALTVLLAAVEGISGHADTL